MQEQVSASLPVHDRDRRTAGNTPSLEEVRDKIERRYANAMGSAELAQELGAGPHARGPAGQRADGRPRPPRSRSRTLDAGTRFGRRRHGHPGRGGSPGHGPRPTSRNFRASRVRGSGQQSGPRPALARRGAAAWRRPASAAVDVVASRLAAAADPGRCCANVGGRCGWPGSSASRPSSGILVTGLLATWNPGAADHRADRLRARLSPAALLFLRYRWLRAEPLPRERSDGDRRLPPSGRPRGRRCPRWAPPARIWWSLIGVIERGGLLPADEVGEVRRGGAPVGGGHGRDRRQVVSMERAAGASPQARAHLAPHQRVHRAAVAGVRQYNEMVTAAAHLVSAANGTGGAPVPLPGITTGAS